MRRLLLLCVLFAGAASGATPKDNMRTIAISAHRFAYSQPEIHVKKGVPLTLELTSTDRVHGFNLPDFHVRTDIVPGKVTRVRILPDKAGHFVFFCDHFCGEGHENMSGMLVVED